MTLVQRCHHRLADVPWPEGLGFILYWFRLQADMFIGGLRFDRKECLRSVAGGLPPARFGTTLSDETFTPSVFRSFLVYVKERLRLVVGGLLPARFVTNLSEQSFLSSLFGDLL